MTLTPQPADIACPVCGARDTISCGPPAYIRPTRVAGVAIDLSDLQLLHRRCASCGFRFVHPPIPAERLLNCYQLSPAQQYGTVGQDVAAGRRYARKKELLDQWVGGSRRVVDIGCFDGGFLTFLGAGWDKFGVEPSAAAAVASRERGIQIIAPTLQAVPQEFCGSFDAAIALDVIEHLSDPVTELRLIARLIKPGGILMIETGNTDS